MRLAFDAAERNGKFGYIQCQRSKECSSRGKRRLYLRRRTVRIEVKSKVIPSSFLEIEGRVIFVRAKEGWLVELVGNHCPSPEAAPMSKRERERRKKRSLNVRREATARNAMEKSKYVGVVEVRGDNPVKCFLPTEVRSIF